jgi:hypothetical protein
MLLRKMHFSVQSLCLGTSVVLLFVDDFQAKENHEAPRHRDYTKRKSREFLFDGSAKLLQRRSS